MAKRPTPGETENRVHKKGKTERKLARINSEYYDQTGDTFKTLQKIWRNDKELVDQSEFIIRDPFLVCTLPDFLVENSLNNGYNGNQIEGNIFEDELMKELDELPFHEKNNDLYQFSQSDDLKNFSTPYIEEFRYLLEEEALPWLRELTGIGLSKDIAMTCSKYKYTDRLLCHDDELDKRKIAFIYYMVPLEWSSNDGGKLDLFSVDENGQPASVSHSIVPCRNSFLFFEVTPHSFHQVSEVLSTSRTRLSINGWFHGMSLPRPLPYMEPVPEFSTPIELQLEILEEWINPMYLDIGVQVQIQQQFEEDSQIELPNFLREEKYVQTCKELIATDSWTTSGPPDKRHVIKMADNKKLSSSHILKLLLSEPFCLVLSHITGLNLSDRFINPCSNNISQTSTESQSCSSTSNQLSRETACCHGNMFLWKPGCYTLMSDNLPCQNEYLLEVVLHFNTDEWMPEMGGVTSYVLKNEDEELLSVVPQNNSLSVVYKDKYTMNYVQYHNNRGHGKLYHNVIAVYRESCQPSEQDSDQGGRDLDQDGCGSDQNECGLDQDGRGSDQDYSSDDD